MAERTLLIARPTDIPGLFDLFDFDGTLFLGDATKGQIFSLAMQGYEIQRASND